VLRSIALHWILCVDGYRNCPRAYPRYGPDVAGADVHDVDGSGVVEMVSPDSFAWHTADGLTRRSSLHAGFVAGALG
jgi:hypothetical protein